ncbi:trifunctional dihydropteroate synthetase/dihydrohydroxymethylpterin pyrophosphokinase/dihydroneopterin aldolase FOL1 SCDLUD_003916 [Saccharomycodes ludwigii]|uniref:trifunctional dihydropteroate synthetase/dihydrohydroxymethylpterin pyrophosphokinase/dihydroneopterin aldolase FOL1 n=1 Tax=Saccharomycodes ludwigii TaxID=36035 RepID=UPI001E8A9417|nr:hypothetical protein SCDLUD_003916 [Saccharomycodes ludwigii]KAH3899635.1 hypothetical protein SCDLUD_003916 [Saccharomycodes ludwigii]
MISKFRSFHKDSVHIDRLNLTNVVVGPDAWNLLKPQPCYININMNTDFRKASKDDDLKYSLNYAVISRDLVSQITKTTGSTKFRNLLELSNYLNKHLLETYKGIQSLQTECILPNANIRCKEVILQTNQEDEHNITSTPTSCKLILKDIQLLTLIGVFTFERLQKQFITLDIEIPIFGTFFPNYRKIIKVVCDYLESENFKTVEALVESTAQLIFQEFPDISGNETSTKENGQILVKVTKLNAITDTLGVGVKCLRNINDFENRSKILLNTTGNTIDTASNTFDLPLKSKATNVNNTQNYKNSVCYLAFGSNMNDKLSNILQSFQNLENVPGNKILDISSIYESEPMYFEDQDFFYNGVIKLQTNFPPHELLRYCKKIEYECLQRVKHFDNGPRTIDLDLLLYFNELQEPVNLNTRDLIIPHPRMLERGFVLLPLCEIIPPDLVHPITAEPIWDHLNQLSKPWGLSKVLPLSGNRTGLKYNIPRNSGTSGNNPTYIMSVINATPDSFSDGDPNFTIDGKIAQIKKNIKDVLAIYPEQKIILDIGGCSTRPGSEQPSIKEEITRIEPILLKLTEELLSDNDNILISVDTYRAEVAAKAIELGCDIINDISMGSLSNDGTAMFELLSKNPTVGYVLSHFRGDVSSMNKHADYSNRDLVNAICEELDVAIDRCLSHGMKRWQLILDPGIGFAKNGPQNIQLIKNLHKFDEYFRSYYPILIGPSRKKFLGTITNELIASRRDIETMAVISMCAGNNTCDIVRVHDPRICAKTLKVVDTLRS